MIAALAWLACPLCLALACLPTGLRLELHQVEVCTPHGICSSRARRCGVWVTWHLPRRLLCRRVASGGVGWSWGAGGVVQHW